MFENQTIIADHDAELEGELHALEGAVLPLSSPPIAPTNKGFELPRNVWGLMIAFYAIFFVAISFATGGSGPARFAITVSVLYTVMYFGLARIGARQAGPEERSPLDRRASLSTATGLMKSKAVYGQVLIVPASIAFFGLAILVITSVLL